MHYFMSLGGGLYIDAMKMGSVSRFMNHSCNPNCRAEKWCVDGLPVIGIFAIRNITIGEELTFDYNFDNTGDFVCRCGEVSCRGTVQSSFQRLPPSVIYGYGGAGIRIDLSVVMDIFRISANYLGIAPYEVINNSRSGQFLHLVRTLVKNTVAINKRGRELLSDAELLEYFVRQYLESEMSTHLRELKKTIKRISNL